MKRHPCDVLGVARDHTPEQLRAAWREAVIRTHPDHGGSDEAFREARAAYEYLRDPQARARVDRGEISLDDLFNEISQRIAEVAPDILAALDEIEALRAAPGILGKLGPLAGMFMHGTRAYARLRRGQ